MSSASSASSSAQPHATGVNYGGVALACREYLKCVMGKVSGLKCLVLDNETTSICAMVMSQSEVLQKEVYLVERIDAEKRPKMPHLKGLFFIRPTPDNFLRLAKELKDPRFAEYNIFFSNTIPHGQLVRLARCDEHELVRQVQEVFADVYAIGRDLFSLELPSTSLLTLETSLWTAYEEALFQRCVDGLFSACLLMRVEPIVRYPRNSQLSRKLATQLQAKIFEEHSLLDGLEPSRGRASRVREGGEGGTVMLIVDRREDPVTPLLNQWTYQGMVHELVGIVKNKVDLTKAPGHSKENNVVLLDECVDPFFERHLTSNFGDVAVAVNEYVREYQARVQDTQKIQTLDEMQKFVDSYDKYRHLSSNVSKHVAILHELSRLVDKNRLFEVSNLEQNLACYESRESHFKRVLETLRNPAMPNMERLRLVLLYALRYEADPAISTLKRELKSAGIADDQVNLVDGLLAYAGSHARSADLFSNKNFLSIAKNVVARNIVKGVENVYTQHKSLLASILEALLRGRLRETSYPFAPSSTELAFNAKPGQASASASAAKPSEVVVFMLGGATYEEARDAAALAQQFNTRIWIGGTTFHSAGSFLADVAQLSKQGRRTLERRDSVAFTADFESSSVGVFSRSY